MLSKLSKRLAPVTILFTAAAAADPSIYVINGSQQFGTIDVATGTFQQIGSTPSPASGYFGLAGSANGSLLTFLYNGDVEAINPATGGATFVGRSGLGDCTMVGVSPCSPTSAFTMGSLAGNIYATDFQNDLYSINALTGAATLIAHKVIPPSRFVLGSQNGDGTLNFADEAMWGAGGKLYITFDAF